MECQTSVRTVGQTWGERIMTREEAIKQIKWYFEMDDGISADDVTKRAINMAINALGEQPRPIDPTVEVDLASGVVPRSALNRVTNPPKVTLHVNRPKGHWITYKDEHLCSVCKGVVTDEWYHEDDYYDYCPWCGIEMDGEDK